MGSGLINSNFVPLTDDPVFISKSLHSPKIADKELSASEKATAAIASPIFDFSAILDPDEHPLNNHFKQDDESLDSPVYTKVGSPKFEPQSENLSDEISKFLSNHLEFEKLYDAWKQFFNGLGTGITNSLSVGEYIDRNGKNTRDLSALALTSEEYQMLGNRTKFAHGLFKWADLTILFILNTWKYYGLAMLREKFKSHRAQFEKLQPKIKNECYAGDKSSKMAILQKRMEHLGQQLNSNHEDITNQLTHKGAKLASYISAFPLEYFGLAHNVANRVCKCTYGMIRGWIGIGSIKQALAIQREWKFQLQPPNYPDIVGIEETPNHFGKCDLIPLPISWLPCKSVLACKKLNKCSTIRASL